MSANQSTGFVRREFLLRSIGTAAGVGVLTNGVLGDEATSPPERDTALTGAIGLVSASAQAQLMGKAGGRRFTLLELPRILREELDLTVLDLNTMSFPDFSTVSVAYLERLRSAAAAAGCVLTNLKLNQRGFDMNSSDAETRRRALQEYHRSIDIAAELGCRWVRPLPGPGKPDLSIHVASYQNLCDYGAAKQVQLLVENFGWMQADPAAVPALVTAIGRNVAACPDTGNWDSNDIRYAGLARAFPLAVTCDFKARKFGPDGEHSDYDLKRCFEIAWSAGFRGPWAIEHGNSETGLFLTGVARIRDLLRLWTAEKSA